MAMVGVIELGVCYRRGIFKGFAQQGRLSQNAPLLDDQAERQKTECFETMVQFGVTLRRTNCLAGPLAGSTL